MYVLQFRNRVAPRSVNPAEIAPKYFGPTYWLSAFPSRVPTLSAGIGVSCRSQPDVVWGWKRSLVKAIY